MKYVKILASAALATAGVFLGGATAYAATVSGTISSDTTWTNQIYEVTGNVYVNPGVTLTIDPGAIIKFDAAVSLYVYGALNAEGSTTSPIYFTSVNDDVGGDTNGTAVLPVVGDWDTLYTSSTGSTTLDYVIVRYGGFCSYAHTVCANVADYGGVLTVLNSEVASSSTLGILAHSGTTTISVSNIHHSRYGYGQDSGSGSVDSSNLHDNVYSNFYINDGSFSVTDSLFSGNVDTAIVNPSVVFTHSGNAASSTVNHIAGFKTNGSFSSSREWTGGDAVPYVITGSTSINPGATLTIDPAAIVKFDSGARLSVNGTLDAEGTAGSPIYLTSTQDDLIGGDTNGNGTTTPAAGYWETIYTSSTGSTTLNHAVVRYGGHCSSPYIGCADVANYGGILSVSDSEISNSPNHGIHSNGGTTTVSGTEIHHTNYGYLFDGGTSDISHSMIHDNASYGMYNSTSVTTTAENNYWGSSSGPYNPSSNPSGTGNAVSNYIDFTPYSPTPVMKHYTDISITSVSTTTGNAVLAWKFLGNATTTYLSELERAFSTWNTLNHVNIATGTPPFLATIEIGDVNNPHDPSKGSYLPPQYSESGLGQAVINLFSVGSSSSNI